MKTTVGRLRALIEHELDGKSLFDCQLCSASSWGGYDGPEGWSHIEGIDGPNMVCPECAAGGDVSSFVEDGYPNARIMKYEDNNG